MFRQEDRPQTENDRRIPLRVEGTSLLLGSLSPLFDRHSNAYIAFSKSIDAQLTQFELHWAETVPARARFVALLPEVPSVGKPKPR